MQARPLADIGQAMSQWARRGNMNSTGRFRQFVDYCGIALLWMSRGYAYDKRTFAQRMVAGNWYWRAAFRALAGRHA